MSTALAIAGVTTVLRDRLNDGLVNHNVAGILGKSVMVSVVAPDRVVPANGSESSQLNLFLRQVTPHAGWRNEGLPHRHPPLALDLHYLISAYSGGDLHAEILLGYAMQLMHEFPVITPEMIRTALTPSPDIGIVLPPALRALADCGLAEQLELLRITPQTLSTEETAKLWSATQANYRPSAAYQVSVVLIDARRPARSPLPVLTRGERDPVTHRERGVVVSPDLIPPLPMLVTIEPPARQPVARLGEPLTFHGHNLDGTNREVFLGNPLFAVEEVLAASGPNVGDRLELTIPLNRAPDFPVGVYASGVRLIRSGELLPRESNQLAFTLAPEITNLPQAVVRDGNHTAKVHVTFTPQLRRGQRVTLIVGSREFAPDSFVTPTAALDFQILDAELGTHLVRLRIDGIDSPLVDHSATPPTFLPKQLTIQ